MINHYYALKNKEFNQKQKSDKIKPKLIKNEPSHPPLGGQSTTKS